jgi:tyrosine-protein kinase Etk/Wzc
MKKRNETESSNALFKEYLLKVYYLKYFYVGCIALFLAVAFLVNHYSPKSYQITALVGPTQNNSGKVLASESYFSGMGVYNKGNNIEDAINSLNSFSLISATVSSMNIEVGYFSERPNILKQTDELYLNSPFDVKIDKSHIQAIGTKFYITLLNDTTFRLTASNKNAFLYNYIDNRIVSGKEYVFYDSSCKFNETITSKDFKFSVSFVKENLPTGKRAKDLFYFELYHSEELAKSYLENMKIEPVSVLASIINLQFTGNNIDKSIAFVNSYLNTFLNENLSKKNQVAKNTITFIDSQISELSDSLTKSESTLRNYRSANQVMDLSFQGQRTYDQMAQYETQKSNLEAQGRYYDYVINLLRTNQDFSGVVPPSSANITDPIMNKLVTDLVALNTERSGIAMKNNNEKNLFLVQVDNRIKTAKQNLLDNVTNNLNAINLSLNELNYKSEKLSREISNMPKTEMNMTNIQRKFKLNDNIFTYLLQKRSEAYITLASTYPDYEVLEPAREITSKIVKPKPLINYLIAMFLGLLIPTIFLILRDLLNDKISSIFDVEQLLDRSVFGIIYSNTKRYEAVVVESPKSAIAESFRNLRSSIFLKLKPEKTKVLLVTSSQPGDGKSFISFNLAASIASVGYKTVLIDCDLRRPTLHIKLNQDNMPEADLLLRNYKEKGRRFLGFGKKRSQADEKRFSSPMMNHRREDEKGISNYMAKMAKEGEIIQETSIPNLFFIPAGPIITNPSELIDKGVLDDLIHSLREKYDYVIIDTPPVGLVADSIQLMQYASQILVVSRINSTQKDILVNALTSMHMNKIENYEVIVNDLNLEKSPYSGYKNYYLKE